MLLCQKPFYPEIVDGNRYIEAMVARRRLVRNATPLLGKKISVPMIPVIPFGGAWTVAWKPRLP